MKIFISLLLSFSLMAQNFKVSGTINCSGSLTVNAIANNLTVYPTNLQSFFGKSLPVGSPQNQWPYYDTVITSAANWFMGLQTSSCSLSPDGCYVDYWDTPGTGTVSASSGSNTITFTGVNPETQFCGGSTSPVNSPAVVIYTNSGANRYITGTVTACSTTTLSVYYAIPFAVSAGTQYGYADNTMITNLAGQSTNANYYDNVVAFYNQYYRTGNAAYLTAARYLASYEWNGPYIDKGNFVNDPNGNRILHPRQIAFAGLVLWQLDQGLAGWTNLENIANYYSTYGMNPGTLAAPNTPLYDTREDSYAFDMSALIALYDTNSGPKAAALATANNIFNNVFEPAHNTSLGVSYPELSFGEASWNGSGGTVNVTNGSNIIQGVGTSWNGSEANLSFWSTTQSNPTSNSFGDPAPAYLVGSVNVGSQTLTLTTPYTGSTATGKYWQVNNLVGIGNQMYEMGITYQALRHYYLAGGSNPSTILNRMAGIVTYLTSTSGGYTGSPEYGLWYGRMFPNCEPNPVACSGSTAENSRSLTGEILAALADNYDRTRSATDLTNANTLFNAMWANPGDGNGVTELNSPGAGTAAKWFGFYGGFSLGPWWIAESLVPHS